MEKNVASLKYLVKISHFRCKVLLIYLAGFNVRHLRRKRRVSLVLCVCRSIISHTHTHWIGKLQKHCMDLSCVRHNPVTINRQQRSLLPLFVPQHKKPKWKIISSFDWNTRKKLVDKQHQQLSIRKRTTSLPSIHSNASASIDTHKTNQPKTKKKIHETSYSTVRLPLRKCNGIQVDCTVGYFKPYNLIINSK